jgi:hypothetical protein
MIGIYEPASGLKGARRWRVVYRPDPESPWGHYELVDARANIVRFTSYDSAKRQADELNRGRITPEKHPDHGYRMPKR